MCTFSQIGKVELLNLDFSPNKECFRLIGIFFLPIGEKFGTGKPDKVLYREKALYGFSVSLRLIGFNVMTNFIFTSQSCVRTVIYTTNRVVPGQFSQRQITSS